MNFFNSASFVLFTALTTQALAETPEGMHLRSLTYNGVGCPAPSDNVGFHWDEDGGLILNLPNMLADWGPGIAKMESRKNCVVTLDIAVPDGWQYALKGWDAKGFAQLDAGLKAEVGILHLFEGGPMARKIHTFQGPMKDVFIIQDRAAISALQWSRCDRPQKLQVRDLLYVISIN